MFLRLSKFVYFASLIVPLLFAKLGTDLATLSTLWGLSLQSLIGLFLFFYIRGYEHKNQNWVYLGYSIVFLGLGGAYLSPKSLWLLFFWELSTVGVILIYLGSNLKASAILSVVTITLASGISMVFLAFWVFSEPTPLANYCFLIGILLKSAFSGFHFWLPEAHSGPPSHGSAVYSGLFVNLPLLLFFRNYEFLQNSTFLLQSLILLGGLGVFLGGITSFFHQDIKKSLAYSTIENINLLWLLAFLYLYFSFLEPQNLNIGTGFLVLFFIFLTHHSISKVFQFLSFGYIVKIAGTTSLDLAKGFGKISGLSFLAMTLGTLSFCGIPGSLGFFAEGTFLYLSSIILDLPISKSVFILPSLIFISIGIVFGAASHLKIYLTLVLSVPNHSNSASQENKTISTTLELLGLSIFVLPFVAFLFSLGPLKLFHFPTLLQEWFEKTIFLSLIVVIFLTFIYFLRFHRIQKRITWDCGSDYKGNDVSIPGSIISDPLYESVGRYMNYETGESRVDSFVHKIIHFGFKKSRIWVQFTEEAELSTYLFISALSVIFIILTIISFSELGI